MNTAPTTENISTSEDNWQLTKILDHYMTCSNCTSNLYFQISNFELIENIILEVFSVTFTILCPLANYNKAISQT